MTAESGLGTIFLAALALVLVIEGAAYALFPDGMRRMLTIASELPAARLRVFGLWAAVIGLVLARLVWL